MLWELLVDVREWHEWHAGQCVPESPSSLTVRSRFSRMTGTRAATAKAATKLVKKEVQDSCRQEEQRAQFQSMVWKKRKGFARWSCRESA